MSLTFLYVLSSGCLSLFVWSIVVYSFKFAEVHYNNPHIVTLIQNRYPDVPIGTNYFIIILIAFVIALIVASFLRLILSRRFLRVINLIVAICSSFIIGMFVFIALNSKTIKDHPPNKINYSTSYINTILASEECKDMRNISEKLLNGILKYLKSLHASKFITEAESLLEDGIRTKNKITDNDDLSVTDTEIEENVDERVIDMDDMDEFGRKKETDTEFGA